MSYSTGVRGVGDRLISSTGEGGRLIRAFYLDPSIITPTLRHGIEFYSSPFTSTLTYCPTTLEVGIFVFIMDSRGRVLNRI